MVKLIILPFSNGRKNYFSLAFKVNRSSHAGIPILEGVLEAHFYSTQCYNLEHQVYLR